MRITHELRLVLREWGRRLAERGTLDSADDVHYLSMDEIYYPPADSKELVARRRAERSRLAASGLPGSLPPALDAGSAQRGYRRCGGHGPGRVAGHRARPGADHEPRRRRLRTGGGAGRQRHRHRVDSLLRLRRRDRHQRRRADVARRHRGPRIRGARRGQHADRDPAPQKRSTGRGRRHRGHRSHHRRRHSPRCRKDEYRGSNKGDFGHRTLVGTFEPTGDRLRSDPDVLRPLVVDYLVLPQLPRRRRQAALRLSRRPGPGGLPTRHLLRVPRRRVAQDDHAGRTRVLPRAGRDHRLRRPVPHREQASPNRATPPANRSRWTRTATELRYREGDELQFGGRRIGPGMQVYVPSGPTPLLLHLTAAQGFGYGIRKAGARASCGWTTATCRPG